MLGMSHFYRKVSVLHASSHAAGGLPRGIPVQGLAIDVNRQVPLATFSESTVVEAGLSFHSLRLDEPIGLTLTLYSMGAPLRKQDSKASKAFLPPPANGPGPGVSYL